MSVFIFRDPVAPRRFGTSVLFGVSVLLICVSALIWSISARNYAAIADLQSTINRADEINSRRISLANPVSFYQSDTPQLAQAQMQSEMQAVAEEYDLQLEVIRADQIEQIDGHVLMGLTLNGVVPEENLGGYLQALAAHEPMIVVETINLRRARSSNRGADDRPLAIQLKLSGFTAQ